MQIEANKKVLALAGNSHAEVARILGYTDRRNVWQWTGLLRPFPPYHCMKLEKHFAGAVTRKELRPHDWEKHWDNLGKSRSKPKTTTAAA